MASEHEHYELTDFQNSAIVEGCGFSTQVEGACDLNLSHQTVSSFLSPYDEWKSTENLLHPGSLRKLTESDIHYLVHTADLETCILLAEIAVNTTFSHVSI